MVYEGVAPAGRARRHRRVAHVMTELYAERGDDVAAELALHWDRGGEPELAAERYLAAARRALDVYGNEDAARNLVRALELSTSRRVRFDALLLRERIAAADGARALQAEIIADLTQLARTIDDEDAACTALERRIALADVTGDRRRERVLRRAAAAARPALGRGALARRMAGSRGALPPRDQRLRRGARRVRRADRAHRAHRRPRRARERAPRVRGHVHLRRPARRSVSRARRPARRRARRRRPRRARAHADRVLPRGAGAAGLRRDVALRRRRRTT